MTPKIESQDAHEFLILKGIQALKQEVTNELNSKGEEQLLNGTTLDKIFQLFEESIQSRNELLASKDEQIKSMKAIGELYYENAQLKEQFSMAKETIKEQADRIDQFEEERSQQQQEMNNIRFSTQQQLLDNATKQNDINDIKKQLLQEKKELKEAQEKHAKDKEEFMQKQLELDNCRKEVEQREEKLDNREEELNTREQHLDEGQMTKDVKHIAKKIKLNACINEFSTKQKEYDAVITVLAHALSCYGMYANDTERLLRRSIDRYRLVRWKTVRNRFTIAYTSIRRYLHKNLTNNVSKEKRLVDEIVVYKYY